MMIDEGKQKKNKVNKTVSIVKMNGSIYIIFHNGLEPLWLLLSMIPSAYLIGE